VKKKKKKKKEKKEKGKRKKDFGSSGYSYRRHAGIERSGGLRDRKREDERTNEARYARTVAFRVQDGMDGHGRFAELLFFIFYLFRWDCKLPHKKKFGVRCRSCEREGFWFGDGGSCMEAVFIAPRFCRSTNDDDDDGTENGVRESLCPSTPSSSA
jgi:hypothetical protein